MPFSHAILPEGLRAQVPYSTSITRLQLLTCITGIVEVRRIVASEHQTPPSRHPVLHSPSHPPHPSHREHLAPAGSGAAAAGGSRSTVAARVHSLVMALALCHRCPASCAPPKFLQATHPQMVIAVLPRQRAATACSS